MTTQISAPQHTDTIRVVMDGYDTAVLLDVLRAFDPSDNALEHYQFSLEIAWATTAKVALAAIDDGLDVMLTREELAALHCVVAGADVVVDEDYMRVESDLSNLKWKDGYMPRYMAPGKDSVDELMERIELMTPEDLAAHSNKALADLTEGLDA